MAKDKERDLTVRDDHAVVAAGRELFPLQEQLEGVVPRLPQIAIMHQGQHFQMPDGSMEREFTGIIIDMNNSNAWWEVPFDESGGGSPPDCFSRDGVTPELGMPGLQNEICKSCPQNQFGSEIQRDGAAGRGKACKNMKRVHIFIAPDPIPYRLTLPPTSLASADNYVYAVNIKGFAYQMVETTFALKEAQNKTGIEYSELVLTAPMVDAVDRESGKKTRVYVPAGDADFFTQIKKMRGDYFKAMREQDILPEEIE